VSCATIEHRSPKLSGLTLQTTRVQATRAIPSAAFHTPQPPKRVVRAPRTSLAARTRKDMFNMPPRPEIQSPQRGAEDTVQVRYPCRFNCRFVILWRCIAVVRPSRV
jgi:hypothetical protein